MFFLWGNSFTGAIPSSLFKISSLTKIYLDGNQLSDLAGTENVSMLPNLQALSLSDNKFMVSPVDLNVFSPLKQLSVLGLSGIPLSTGNTTSDSDFLLQIEYLDLSGCNVIQFPEFIRNQRNLQRLDLSNNKIKGQVPDWLWRLPDLSRVYLFNNGFLGSLKALPRNEISVLDLSSNAFQGPIFVPSTSIQFYSVSKNNFTGEIPQSICRLTSPLVLDLSSNKIRVQNLRIGLNWG